MKTLFLLPWIMVLNACAGQTSLKSSLLDSSSLDPITSPAPEELRLGDIRYGRERLTEREALSWYFTPEDTFQRGVPRDDQAFESIKVKIFEVGLVEKGKYRGLALERWDVTDESVESGNPVTLSYHHYFLRSPDRLLHLPRMAKGGGARPLWRKNKRGQEVLHYLGGRWNVSMGQDTGFDVPELKWHKRLVVPGEGIFQASSSGESLTSLEARNGAVTPLSTLPKGREVYRVPGNWVVCVFPDGLAVPLKKE